MASVASRDSAVEEATLTESRAEIRAKLSRSAAVEAAIAANSTLDARIVCCLKFKTSLAGRLKDGT